MAIRPAGPRPAEAVDGGINAADGGTTEIGQSVTRLSPIVISHAAESPGVMAYGAPTVTASSASYRQPVTVGEWIDYFYEDNDQELLGLLTRAGAIRADAAQQTFVLNVTQYQPQEAGRLAQFLTWLGDDPRYQERVLQVIALRYNIDVGRAVVRKYHTPQGELAVNAAESELRNILTRYPHDQAVDRASAKIGEKLQQSTAVAAAAGWLIARSAWCNYYGNFPLAAEGWKQNHGIAHFAWREGRDKWGIDVADVVANSPIGLIAASALRGETLRPEQIKQLFTETDSLYTTIGRERILGSVVVRIVMPGGNTAMGTLGGEGLTVRDVIMDAFWLAKFIQPLVNTERFTQLVQVLATTNSAIVAGYAMASAVDSYKHGNYGLGLIRTALAALAVYRMRGTAKPLIDELTKRAGLGTAITVYGGKTTTLPDRIIDGGEHALVTNHSPVVGVGQGITLPIPKLQDYAMSLGYQNATVVLTAGGARITLASPGGAAKSVDTEATEADIRRAINIARYGIDRVYFPPATYFHPDFAYWTAFDEGNAAIAAYHAELAYKAAPVVAAQVEIWAKSWGELTRFKTFQTPPGIANLLYDTRGYYAEYGRFAVFFLPGTAGGRDVVTDLYSLQTANDTHRGAERALDTIWEQVKPALKEAFDSGKPILLTGHSLAGGFVGDLRKRAEDYWNQLVAAGNFPGRDYPVVCYPVAPMRIGGATFTYDAYLSPVWSLVHPNDPVPKLPPWNRPTGHTVLPSITDDRLGGICNVDRSLRSPLDDMQQRELTSAERLILDTALRDPVGSENAAVRQRGLVLSWLANHAIKGYLEDIVDVARDFPGDTPY